VIKAVAGTPEAPVVFLGLSRANTDRLHANQPIAVSLRALHPDLPDVTVVLLAGETEGAIAEDLRALGPVRPAGGSGGHGRAG
jgi:hypothetical protein